MVAPRDQGSRFLRQFALTNGRARSVGRDLPLDTLVQSTGPSRAAYAAMAREQRAIIDMARTPLSIAEISAHLHVHLGIARVMVSDLHALGHVAISKTVGSERGPDLPTLERLLDDLKTY